MTMQVYIWQASKQHSGELKEFKDAEELFQWMKNNEECSQFILDFGSFFDKEDVSVCIYDNYVE